MGIELQHASTASLLTGAIAGNGPAAPTPAAGEPASSERRTLVKLGIVLAVVVVVAWGVLPLALYPIGRPTPVQPVAANHTALNGPQLYAQNCAFCHGDRGDGAGPAAVGLFPRPRNFGEGKFRLKTTTTGCPTDDDLLLVIRRGIPGSAMPSFAHLTEDEQKALVSHVRTLTRGGIYNRLCRKAEEDGDVDLAEVGALTEKQSAVGPCVDIPKQFPEPTPQSIANGQKLYMSVCAACHGPQGRGDGPQVAQLKNDDGSPTRPRDLTAGVFKGGRERERLYARIMVGMPGTPMPASNQFRPDQVADLVNYILSLSPEAPAEGNVAAAVSP